MYGVSEGYLSKFHGPVQRWRIKGTVGNVSFTQDNILTGSFSLSDSCSDTNDIKLGVANIGTLSATFRNVNIPRNQWYGKKITFQIGLVKGDGTTEWVPGNGPYQIDSAEWSAAGVTVEAYNNMRKFDKAFTLTALSTDTPYNLLKFACQECGVAFGMDNLNGFVNSSAYLYLNSQGTDIETWRDVIYWIAQTVGAFCTIDRNGALVLRRFVSSSVDTITEDERFSSVAFSDYITKYTAVSVTIIEDNSTKYYSATVDDGVTMNLGANPFFQSTLSESLITALVAEIGNIRFTPFSAEMLGGIHFDLGDVVTESGGLGNGSSCLITGYDYTFNASYSMQGVGKNPTLESAKGKTDKNLQGLLSRTNLNEVAVYEYTNSSPFTIGDDDNALLCSINMASKIDTKAVIHIEVDLTSASNTPSATYEPDEDNLIHLEDIWGGIKDTATKGKVTYMIESEEDSVHKPVESWIDGKHVLHLMYVLALQSGVSTRFRAYLKSEDGTITIPAGGIWLFASGIGLVGDGKWNGVIEVEDTAAEFNLVEITVASAVDTVDIDLLTPTGISLSDTASDFNVIEIGIGTVTDELTITLHLYSFPRVTEDGIRRVTEDGIARYTEGD